MRIFVLTAALLALATPVFAQTAAPTIAPTAEKKPEAKKEDTNRIVCKRERVTGSNQVEKICMTVAQRDKMRDDGRRATDTNRMGRTSTAQMGAVGNE